ncbi:glycogen/starch/alpha-glucan phosphorylases subfamily [Verrucomicrobiia bacterium DG1235]|nr:glycogen/starch/alpha-glucan phosphorylases subfamily [Verrucomicrobiae bacterium DG1235]
MGLKSKPLAESFVAHLEYSLAKDEFSASQFDFYKSLALTIRDRLVERWVETQQAYYRADAKRVYYLSLEFLPGRLLRNALINLDLEAEMQKALHELGIDLNSLESEEADQGLGNGGLGRLAACFMDSLATLAIPACGYGIRYEYGIFSQQIIDGYQVETPDHWLTYGNPWEIERPKFSYTIKFHGHVHEYYDANGRLQHEWLDTEDVMATSYDTMVPGYRNDTVNHIRLWAAKSSKEFNLEYFNDGDYERALCEKVQSETISRVLYPRDDLLKGRKLRLKQECFFVSATMQDILRRHKKSYDRNFELLPAKVAIQLNDTHPTIAIPELMRLLMDSEQLDWAEAWKIVTRCFAYTNHTVLPEALEKWRVSLFENVLPRHLQIIFEINRRFLQEVADRFPDDQARARRMSIIEEGSEKWIRMSHLAIVGSHSVNGVAQLHTEILKKKVFRDFYQLWPLKFNNKTNGITHRRWLTGCNPKLATLIEGKIGNGWQTDLGSIRKLRTVANNNSFQEAWRQVKRANKERLAQHVSKTLGIQLNPDSMFDSQIKRIHEYKRQLLNVLHVITLYYRILLNPNKPTTPRTVIFAGKAAPSYSSAKLIIKLINSVADTINKDPRMKDRLTVVFLPDYSVTLAELIIPAADLSEQISTAGMEASGTGNMKFALNGALTIGTLDGANIEIIEEVGAENAFIFGLTANEIEKHRASKSYSPSTIYERDPELKNALDAIAQGHFSPEEPKLFKEIVDTLLREGDYYFLLADYRSYLRCQEDVDHAYRNPKQWTRMSILNVAGSSKFSSDRAIHQYAEEIWKAKPVPVKLKNKKPKNRQYLWKVPRTPKRKIRPTASPQTLSHS